MFQRWSLICRFLARVRKLGRRLRLAWRSWSHRTIRIISCYFDKLTLQWKTFEWNFNLREWVRSMDNYQTDSSSCVKDWGNRALVGRIWIIQINLIAFFRLIGILLLPGQQIVCTKICLNWSYDKYESKLWISKLLLCDKIRWILIILIAHIFQYHAKKIFRTFNQVQLLKSNIKLKLCTTFSYFRSLG